MHIRILGPDRCIHLLSAFDFRRALASGDVEAAGRRDWDDYAARMFLLRHFRAASEMGALRRALAREMGDPARMSDDEVIDAAARRLREGAWRIGYERVRRVDMPGRAAGQVAVAPPSRPPATPSSVPRRAGGAAPGAPAAAAPAEPEWFETADQAAFADVLTRAARDGRPFCEICEQRARQRAAA